MRNSDYNDKEKEKVLLVKGLEFKYYTWGAGKLHTYLYTENESLAKYLKWGFDPAVYSSKGRGVFAWQFLLPTKKVGFILRCFQDGKKTPPRALRSKNLQARYSQDASREAIEGEGRVSNGVREAKP